MRKELNGLQHELSQGLISLEEAPYRSITMKGDFTIRQTPMHRDNPKKVSRCTQSSTTPSTTTQAPLAETMPSKPTTPQKGRSQSPEVTHQNHLETARSMSNDMSEQNIDVLSRPSNAAKLDELIQIIRRFNDEANRRHKLFHEEANRRHELFCEERHRFDERLQRSSQSYAQPTGYSGGV
jgi:hypothetical protein